METTHMMPASVLLSLFLTVLLSQNPIVQGQFPWNGSPDTSPWTPGIQQQQFSTSGFPSTFDTQPGEMMNGWQSNLINQFNGQNFQNPSTQQDNTGRIQNLNFDNLLNSGLQQPFMSSNGIGDPNSPQSTQNGGFGQFQDPSMLGGDLSAFNFARPNDAGMFANSNFQASIPNNFQAGGNIDLPMNLPNGPGGTNMWNANQLGADVPVAPTQTSVPQWMANIPQGMPTSNPSDPFSTTPNELTNSGNNSALNMLESTFARFSQGQQGNAISPFLQGQQDNTVSPFLQGQQDNAISTIPQGQLDNPLSTFQQTQQDNTISPFSQGQQDNTAFQISQSQPDNTRSLFPPGPQDNTRSPFPPGQQDNTLSPFMQGQQDNTLSQFMQGQQDNTLSPFMQGQQDNTLSPFMQGQQANTRFPFMNRFSENLQTQQMGDPQQWQPNSFGPSNWGMNGVGNPRPFDNFSPFVNSRFFAR